MNTKLSGAIAARRALLARLARPAAEMPLRVFCSGIGGTGVSALVRLLTGLGHSVRGSDRSASPLSKNLEALGIEITYAQSAENVTSGTDIFVATAALPHNHPELVAAIEQRIPVVKYAEALGALVAARRGIAISGTHGKTTTTALTAHVLRTCGRSPSWVVGGQPKDLPANAALGDGQELVFEACEFDHSFRNYVPAIAVVLNVEVDHFDCYQGGLDQIVDAFVEFGALIKEGGTLIVSADWPAAVRVADMVRAVRPDVAVETFSLHPEGGRFSAQDIEIEQGLPCFTLLVDGVRVSRVRLALAGRHNVANALAAIAAAVRVGVDPAKAAAAVSTYNGVRRRFDVLQRGEIVVVDDYAHHPTAIKAVIAGARDRFPDRRVLVCFEPHQANRTRHLFNDFADALATADRVLLSDIYVCRDTQEDVSAISASDLAMELRIRAPHTEAQHAGDQDALAAAALEIIGPGDLVLFLGAGRISRTARRVVMDLRGAEVPAPPPSPAPLRPYFSAPRILLPDAMEKRIQRALGSLVERDVVLAPYCTFKAGGRARFFSSPKTTAEAVRVMTTLRGLGVPVVPLGGGSNTLFASDLFDGAVILTRRIRGARVLGTTIRAAAGATLPGVIRLAERSGLAGLECFAGIPGTLGGAVCGNAGGPNGAGTVGDRVVRALVVDPDGKTRWRTQGDLGLRYRGSDLDGCLILSVDLELSKDHPDRLKRTRSSTTRRKGLTQPLDARSAGCVFRNPTGQSAGRLIDVLGLKGLTRGGARVSDLHGNFIVNEGGATPGDILQLIQDVRARVLEARGIHLETELRLVA